MEFLDISSIDGSDSSMCSLEDRGREILVISINIGNGKTDEIAIHQNDTPRFLAKEFCKKHNLNPGAEKVIIEVVKEHLKTKPVVETSKFVQSQNFEKPEQDLNTLNNEKKKETGQTVIEKNPVDFNHVVRAVMRRNTGERLYNEALQHKEQYEKKINELRERFEKEQLKETTFKPNLKSEKSALRQSFIGNEGHLKNSLDRYQPSDQVKHLTGNKETPIRASSSSPSLSQKILKSRKLLQGYLDLKEQGRKSTGKLRPASKERPKRVFRSQSNERKNVKLSNEQTDKIINRLKTIRFIQLFDNLNPNEKQEINKKTIERPRISKRLQIVLKPFFEELKNLSLSLNLEEFCRIMELYLRDLTPVDRNLLLQIGKKKAGKRASGLNRSRELESDLWSPKYEQKLLVFEQFPECS